MKIITISITYLLLNVLLINTFSYNFIIVASIYLFLLLSLLVVLLFLMKTYNEYFEDLKKEERYHRIRLEALNKELIELQKKYQTIVIKLANRL